MGAVMESSRQLLERATRGDVVAVDDLMTRHLPALHAFVRLEAGAWLQGKESCTDLVQSACREVLVDLDDYRYETEGQFRDWLFGTALRKIKDRARYWRAEKRDVGREATPSPAEGAISPGLDIVGLYAGLTSPSQSAMAFETVERFERAFAVIPEDYRDVIVKKVVVGLSYREIAAAERKEEAAVRKTYSRATSRLIRVLCEDAP